MIRGMRALGRGAATLALPRCSPRAGVSRSHLRRPRSGMPRARTRRRRSARRFPPRPPPSRPPRPRHHRPSRSTGRRPLRSTWPRARSGGAWRWRPPSWRVGSGAAECSRAPASPARSPPPPYGRHPAVERTARLWRGSDRLGRCGRDRRLPSWRLPGRAGGSDRRRAMAAGGSGPCPAGDPRRRRHPGRGEHRGEGARCRRAGHRDRAMACRPHRSAQRCRRGRRPRRGVGRLRRMADPVLRVPRTGHRCRGVAPARRQPRWARGRW